MRGAGANSSSSATRNASRAGDVVRAVEQHERMAADDLEPARRLHARERVGDDVGRAARRRTPPPRRARSPRCRPGARRAAAGTRRGSSAPGLRRSTQAAADREHVATHTEVDVAAQDTLRARACSKIGSRSGSVSPSTSVAPGFTMPAFSVAICSRGRSEILDVVDAHVGDDRDVAVDDVGRVPRSAHADLDDRDVDGFVGEPAERGRGDDLEVRRLDADSTARRARPRAAARRASSSAIGSPSIDMRSLTRSRCGLVYAPTVSPTRREQLGDHRGRRGLAVRAGEVDRRELELGRAEVLHQRARCARAWARPRRLPARAR